ncbi:MAG: hypothetical protein LBQ65_06680 [Tannerellaceae bacterium]|nr:hypothetical protein [Tannerellaceae bacterium]
MAGAHIISDGDYFDEDVESKEKEDDKVVFVLERILSSVLYFCANQSFVFPAQYASSFLEKEGGSIPIFYCHFE